MFIEKNIIIENTNSKKNESSNYIKDINYKAADLKGNKYEVTAEQGEVEVDKPDVMFLNNVIAYIYLKDSSKIKITSDFGKYNSKNYDTIFSKNVVVDYPDHEITGEYLDFSFLSNLGTISGNVIYTGNKNKLFGDRLEMNIATKDTKIFMDESNKKVLITGTQ